MGTTLWQAAVSAGKTQAALERLAHHINDPQRPFAKVWVLLATRRQEVAFRQRLIDLHSGRAVYFNAEFFNFYTLNERLLNLAGEPQRRIADAARAGLLRRVLMRLQAAGQLPTFAPIAHTAGFLRVVADLIDELKQHRVEPNRFVQAAATAKDHELARIYSAYQDVLIQHQLVDREGEGWVALDTVVDNADLTQHVSLLLVDGYDQFTSVQAALLAQLSLQIDDVFITLTQAPDDRLRPDDQPVIGRRFAGARQRLNDAHAASGAAFTVQTAQVTDTQSGDGRHPDLMHLTRHIFSQHDPVPATGGVQMIEAPDPLTEVAAVLREVKRLLLDGVVPDQILIALRDWPRYHTYFELYRHRYGLPLLLHYSAPISSNPALTVLMQILALSGKDPDAVTAFRRRDLLDVLRSPYIAFKEMTPQVVDNLDKVSRARQVLGGRQNWLDAVASADQPQFEEDDNREHAPLLEPAEQAALSLALEDFFRVITPPPQSTHQGYVMWLETLIGADPLRDPSDAADEAENGVPEDVNAGYDTLHMPQRIHDVSQMPTPLDVERLESRDVQALNQFKELLRDILTTQEFLRTALGDQPLRITWPDFFADLQAGVRYMHPSSRNPSRSGRVLVTTAAEARGLPHAYTFILGLSEGIFPAALPEDPLYLDSERLRFQERGVPLPTQGERSDDDGIFYELVSQPSRRLTLTRPHVREGKPWVESHLWRMVRAVFSDFAVERIGIGQVIPAPDVATRDEAAITVAHNLSNPSETERDAVLGLHQWLAASHESYWQTIQHGRETEMQRMGRSAHDAYSGVLHHPGLIELVADELDSDYLWSATRLSAYGTCPYRFFAGYLLKLDELDEPQEGLDALQLGSLNHKILEMTYSYIAHEGLTITPANLDDALDILNEVALPLLASAPEEYGFRASALWEQEQHVLLRRLAHLLQVDFSADAPLNKLGAPRRPYQLEMKFGFDSEALRVPIGDQYLRVRGMIDRIDIAGDRLIVIDYKTGSTPFRTDDIIAGRNFQMMLYILALQAHIKMRSDWPQHIAGGAFFHVRNAKVSGQLNPADEDDRAALEMGREHIAAYLERMRQGDFSVQPSQPSGQRCTGYCEFYQLCRLSVTNQHKRQG